MAENKLERIYTVPLGAAYEYLRTKRARRAVKLVQQFLVRHMKARNGETIKISTALNEALWERGIQKPPRRVKIRAVKEGETVSAFLVDEKPKTASVKKPETKKDEPKVEKAGGAAKEEPKKPEKKEGYSHEHKHDKEEKKHEARKGSKLS